MLYIIGTGLDFDSISLKGINIVKKCEKVYLENYTVNFPYTREELEKNIGKKIILADREKIESLEIVNEAKKIDIALLVYGSPLTATTHVTLLQEATKKKVKVEIVYNASILDAIAETGLQIYKFGKITSLPEWDEKKNFTPSSFMEIVKENISINAHTLLLIDIGLELEKALEQVEKSAKKHKIILEKIILCQALGTKEKRIIYSSLRNLEKIKIKKPYCIIIPSKLHFIEEESLKEFEKTRD